MSTVVVNDASCLIDLHKGRLLDAKLTLPYRFVVPLPIRHAEALDLTEQDWRRLEHGGLVPFDLPPERVAEAATVKARHPNSQRTTASVWCRHDAMIVASCSPETGCCAG